MGRHQKTRPHRTQEQWLDLIREQQSSGLSATDFCRRRDLSYIGFIQKRKSLIREIKPSHVADDFIQIGQLIHESRSDAVPFEVELALGGGITLRIRRAS